ncbi:hypothetical protein ADEAN_000036800 [Angomonas deanei]|uniref:Tetratricopeptide SHNi-TPR domain-containing protein n=1 Tax=Angomonas deanei TaxID=59799 RepID=A0A7G2C4W4_9TRYP|nr:hypothetical protein ADEAN_000036800 [Angomonas deanei]
MSSPNKPTEVPPKDETNHNNSDSEESSNEEEEEDPLSFFPTPEAVTAARTTALQYYNQQEYEKSCALQAKIAQYVSKKFGPTFYQNGIYFLDYGLSQLRLIALQNANNTDFLKHAMKISQNNNSENENNDEEEEDMETCFINLEVARVCFENEEKQIEDGVHGALETLNDEKNEELKKKYITNQTYLAEVHNALGQLHNEKEDSEAALQEYELENMIYKNLQELFGNTIVDGGKLVSVRYSMAQCYLQEADFDGAVRRLEETISEAEKINAENSENHKINPVLLNEIKEQLSDAKEMANGTFEAIKKQIEEQFCVEQMSQIPSAEEFFSVPKHNENNNNNNNSENNKFISSLPGDHGGDGSHPFHQNSNLSLPISGSGKPLFLGNHHQHLTQNNELSNSQSLSVFPPQRSNSNSAKVFNNNNNNSENNNNNKVQTVVARKKPKPVSEDRNETILKKQKLE